MIKKKIGLDIGTVRIGIATSDILGMLASSYEVYRYDCRKDVPHRRIWACSSGMKAKIKGMILSLFGVKAFCRLFGSGQTV